MFLPDSRLGLPSIIDGYPEGGILTIDRDHHFGEFCESFVYSGMDLASLEVPLVSSVGGYRRSSDGVMDLQTAGFGSGNSDWIHFSRDLDFVSPFIFGIDFFVHPHASDWNRIWSGKSSYAGDEGIEITRVAGSSVQGIDIRYPGGAYARPTRRPGINRFFMIWDGVDFNSYLNFELVDTQLNAQASLVSTGGYTLGNNKVRNEWGGGIGVKYAMFLSGEQIANKTAVRSLMMDPYQFLVPTS